uniref:Metalloendopeptidase n=1 Tax=Timema californicum TaxID=61474 RepID=A0A7R9J372_TIMCA|nr:unnamed protein product [Timema californicum]
MYNYWRVGLRWDVHPERKWTNNTVHYVISPLYETEDYITIYKSITMLNFMTCIRFLPWDGKAEDFLLIWPVKYPKGCWSLVGRFGGPQILSLQPPDSNGPNCLGDEGRPTHEILHALGIFHEQSRADRDNYVKVHYDNIISAYFDDWSWLIYEVDNISESYFLLRIEENLPDLNQVWDTYEEEVNLNYGNPGIDNSSSVSRTDAKATTDTWSYPLHEISELIHLKEIANRAVIPLAKDSRRLTGIYYKVVKYSVIRLPMGHTLPPSILRIAYIDDFLWYSQEKETLEYIPELLYPLGLTLNTKTSSAAPQQHLTYLGFIIDNRDSTLKLTEDAQTWAAALLHHLPSTGSGAAVRGRTLPRDQSTSTAMPPHGQWPDIHHIEENAQSRGFKITPKPTKLLTLLWEHQTTGTSTIRIGTDNTTAFASPLKGRGLTFTDTALCNFHFYVSNKHRTFWIDSYLLGSDLNPADYPSRQQTLQLLQEEAADAATIRMQDIPTDFLELLYI